MAKAEIISRIEKLECQLHLLDKKKRIPILSIFNILTTDHRAMLKIWLLDMLTTDLINLQTELEKL